MLLSELSKHCYVFLGTHCSKHLASRCQLNYFFYTSPAKPTLVSINVHVSVLLARSGLYQLFLHIYLLLLLLLLYWLLLFIINKTKEMKPALGPLGNNWECVQRVQLNLSALCVCKCVLATHMSKGLHVCAPVHFWAHILENKSFVHKILSCCRFVLDAGKV